MDAREGIPKELHPLRVLVVDDSRLDVHLFEILLAHAGHEVVGISDPDQFASAVAYLHPDVVLMDQMLGTSRGTDLADALRATGDDHTPVIATTLYPEEFGSDLPAAILGVIPKPITPRDFADKVEAWTHRYQEEHACPGGR